MYFLKDGENNLLLLLLQIRGSEKWVGPIPGVSRLSFIKVPATSPRCGCAREGCAGVSTVLWVLVTDETGKYNSFLFGDVFFVGLSRVCFIFLQMRTPVETTARACVCKHRPQA